MDVTTGTQTQKRVVKLTTKVLAEKLDRLQNGRKAKLNKASTMRNQMQGLMPKCDKTKVKVRLMNLLRCVKKQNACMILC